MLLSEIKIRDSSQIQKISSVTITFHILPHGVLQNFWQIIEFVSKLLNGGIILSIFGDVDSDRC